MPDKIRIKVNRNVCSGCLSCMTTCSMTNEKYASLAGSRVQVELSPFGGTHQITICQQCTKPKCMEACPENAISVNEASVKVIDYDKCTQCKLCIPACPFHAMFWNPISNKVIKCEQCGGDPECVKACPTGALTIQVVPAKKEA
jgi:carbon-monoxide dehydrogenase iron sulfur subunit